MFHGGRYELQTLSDNGKRAPAITSRLASILKNAKTLKVSGTLVSSEHYRGKVSLDAVLGLIAGCVLFQ